MNPKGFSTQVLFWSQKEGYHQRARKAMILQGLSLPPRKAQPSSRIGVRGTNKQMSAYYSSVHSLIHSFDKDYHLQNTP